MTKKIILSFLFLIAICTMAFAQGDTYQGERLLIKNDNSKKGG